MKKALIALFLIIANTYPITPNQALIWLQILNHPLVQHRLKYIGSEKKPRRAYVPLSRPTASPSYPWRLY